ncbi:hypothetical protein NMG60_11032894 [Bertholletia excelsa]
MAMLLCPLCLWCQGDALAEMVENQQAMGCGPLMGLVNQWPSLVMGLVNWGLGFLPSSLGLPASYFFFLRRRMLNITNNITNQEKPCK